MYVKEEIKAVQILEGFTDNDTKAVEGWPLAYLFKTQKWLPRFGGIMKLSR